MGMGGAAAQQKVVGFFEDFYVGYTFNIDVSGGHLCLSLSICIRVDLLYTLTLLRTFCKINS